MSTAEQRNQRELNYDGKSRKSKSAWMKCILMHRRIPVVQITLDDLSGFIQRVESVYAPEHLPVGVSIHQGCVDRAELNAWWMERSIPASRNGIIEALETLEIANTKMLLVRGLGLSLSDQYWIRPEGMDIPWDQINYFDHTFSDDIGDVLFGENRRTNVLNFNSPDSTSDGNLKKRWKIIDGKRCLIKGGSNPFRQQPFNEVIAAEIMDRLSIPHVPYSILWYQEAPYSVCDDFITRETELVPAWRIIQTQKKSNEIYVYRHFVNCAEALGIPAVVPFLNRMLVLDYIIANEDRHLNNFGAIRNAETLKWVGMAPVYDSGSSLGYDKVTPEIRSGQNMICKPFKKHHEEQLKLVTDYSWIDFDRLSDIRELIVDTLSSDGVEGYIGESRIKAIADAVEQRIQKLQELSRIQKHPQMDSTKDDVVNDTAENYIKTESGDL